MSSSLNNSVRKMFKSGGMVVAGLFIEMAVSFLAKLFIARGLQVDEYGGISLGLTIVTLVSTFILMGVHRGIGRYLPRFEADRDRRGVLISGFGTTLPLSCLAAIFIYLFAPTLATNVFHSPSVAPILRILAWIVPLMTLYDLTLGIVQGVQRSTPKVIIENLAKPISRFLGVVVVIFIGVTATRIAWAYFAGWLVPALLSLFYVVRYTPLLDTELGYKLHTRELLTFSLPLLFSGAMTFIYQDIDTLIIGYLRSPAEVGVYRVVYPLAKMLTVGLTGLSFIFMPLLSEKHSKKNISEFRRLFQVGTKWIIIATLPLFLVVFLFPEMTIAITFGNKYRQGAMTLSVLAIGFFCHAATGLNSAALTSSGDTRIIMYVSAGAAVLNIFLNTVLIPIFGYLGAGIATTASYIALNASLTGFVYLEYQVNPFTKSVIRPAGGAIGLVGVIYILVRSFFPITSKVLVTMFVLFVALYTVAIVRLGGIEAEEVMLLDSIEDRFDLDLEPLKKSIRYLMGTDELPRN